MDQMLAQIVGRHCCLRKLPQRDHRISVVLAFNRYRQTFASVRAL